MICQTLNVSLWSWSCYVRQLWSWQHDNMTDALVCSYMYLGMTTAMMITCRTPWCVLICLRACPTVHSLPSLSRAILAFCHTSIFLFRHFCFRVCVCIYAFVCVYLCLYLCFVLVLCPPYLQLSCHSAFLSSPLSFPYVPLCANNLALFVISPHLFNNSSAILSLTFWSPTFGVTTIKQITIALKLPGKIKNTEPNNNNYM